jgi:peroxiredoxin
VPNRPSRLPATLSAGARAPSFTLPDASSGVPVTDPWADGPAVLAFFKVTCPVCQMVGPKVAALAAGDARLLAIGQDPPAALVRYARERGQQVPTVSEAAPYLVSSAYGISSVPTLVLVEPGGVVADVVGGWDRDRWNAVAAAVGAPAVSHEGDGLPVFRPG